MLAAVKQNGMALKFASDKLRSDHEVVLAAVNENGSALEHAAREFRLDRELVLAAVKNDGSSLKYASDELKADHQVVLTAVEQNGLALGFVSEKLQCYQEVVLAALKKNGLALGQTSERYRSDRAMVLDAVRQEGSALIYASANLKADREIGLAAVQQSGLALRFVSDELRSDREMALAAVKQCGCSLMFCAQELRSDREFVLAAVNENGSALEHAAREFRSDRELVLAAVKNDGLSLKYASDELKADRDIVLTAVGSCGCALRFAASNLRCDRGVALTAVMQDKGALEFADESLQSDQHFLREVSERRTAARNVSVDTRFTLDPSCDAPTAVKFVSEKFAASGKLALDGDTVLLRPLVGFRISSIELLSSAACAAATSALSRMWESRSQGNSGMSSEQLAVRSVFDAMLQESGGASMIVYHGCSASAARSIAEHGFVRSSQRDNGYFGRGIYATPNAEYACRYARATAPCAAVVMCRACVPSAYFVTRADYDESNATGHSKLYGQALKSEEAHFALVSPSTNFEACKPEKAEYCELCVSQVVALCPIAVLWVKAMEGPPGDERSVSAGASLADPRHDIALSGIASSPLSTLPPQLPTVS